MRWLTYDYQAWSDTGWRHAVFDNADGAIMLLLPSLGVLAVGRLTRATGRLWTDDAGR